MTDDGNRLFVKFIVRLAKASATGVAQAARFDAQHRPITAGGYVKAGPVTFQDEAAQAGLTSWRNTTGTAAKRLIIEAKGSGVCLLDYDRVQSRFAR